MDLNEINKKLRETHFNMALIFWPKIFPHIAAIPAKSNARLEWPATRFIWKS